MTLMTKLKREYQRRLEEESDAITKIVASEQLERLDRGTRQRSHDRRRGARAAVLTRPYARHLGALLVAAGNPPLRWRSETCYQTGHQPFHDSRSGTCVVVWLDEGAWWCSSCRRQGGAIEWLAAWRGISRLEAAALLRLHFGNGAP